MDLLSPIATEIWTVKKLENPEIQFFFHKLRESGFGFYFVFRIPHPRIDRNTGTQEGYWTKASRPIRPPGLYI